MSGSIAKRWRELQGAHSWEGLLDPIDIDLRKSLVSYGEMTEAVTDGLNKEDRSPHVGSCIYSHDELLPKTGAAAAGHYYKLTKFIYATSSQRLKDGTVGDKDTNFMGYVAVATDEGVAALGRRDIIVAWRGTETSLEKNNDFDLKQVAAGLVLGPDANPSAKVHRGFLSIYTSSNESSKFIKISARDQVLTEVSRLVEMYKDEEEISITITGHSLGAAITTLNAVDMVANGINKSSNSSKPPILVTAIVFACPRVGDKSFKNAYSSFGEHLKSLHVINDGDIVPKEPFYNVDVHVQLTIHAKNSQYLKYDPEKAEYLQRGLLHNLEVYIHGVAGDQGSAGGFNLEVDRDVALLNKRGDLLKDVYLVPVNWWVPENNCMVRNKDGKWELKDFKEL